MTERARWSDRAVTGSSPLHVVRTGAGDETFMLLHGFGGSSYTWRHWAPHLEERGRVLLVDLKGFGAAAKPADGRYGPEHQVALVDDLIELEDPRRLTLVGHSIGGGIALLSAVRMCERGDDRLRRLVIVSGPAYPQKLPPFVALAAHPLLSQALVRVLGPERIVRIVLRGIVEDEACIDDAQVAAYAAALRTREGVAAALQAARQIVPPDLARIVDRYPSVQVPTLLLWGRGDRVVPLSTARRLAAALPNARLVVMDECGHLPHEEHPDRSLAALRRFLDET